MIKAKKCLLCDEPIEELDTICEECLIATTETVLEALEEDAQQN